MLHSIEVDEMEKKKKKKKEREKMTEDKWRRKQLAKARKKGGLSNAVYTQPRLQSYLKTDFIFGYVGNYHRTIERDRIVERQLRQAGLTDRQIAIWLTSTSARHMMDGVYKGMKKQVFGRLIKQYTKLAKRDLRRWGELNRGR